MSQISFFLETRWSSVSIEPLIVLLACLEPKLWPKHPVVHKSPKTAWVYHWWLVWLAMTHDNLPREHAGELFEPSKDSWSLLVCTEKKKTFEIWVWSFRWVLLEKGYICFCKWFLCHACKQMNPNLKEHLKIYWSKILLKSQKIPNMKNPLLHRLR